MASFTTSNVFAILRSAGPGCSNPAAAPAKPGVVEEASSSNDRRELLRDSQQDLDLICGTLKCDMVPIAVWRTAPQIVRRVAFIPGRIGRIRSAQRFGYVKANIWLANLTGIQFALTAPKLEGGSKIPPASNN